MKSILSVVIFLGVVAAGGYYYLVHFYNTSTVSFRTAQVELGDMSPTIEATGTVEPEQVVDIGSQVNGLITELKVDYGSNVEKDQVLATVDKTLYQATVDQTDAALKSAKANLGQARANLALAESNLKRDDVMIKKGAIAPSQYDADFAAREVDKAIIGVDEAAINQAEATLRQAKINLGYCDIRSPVKGTIVDRRVNVGQTVVSSLSASSLFLLAQDLTRIQVWASVNEADIGRIRPGVKVHFTVDAYPSETFVGVVSQIRLNATMTQNVVTYTVVVTTDNKDLRLLPYMTASLKFEIEHHDNVLKVANAALRWKPRPKQIAPDVRAETLAAMAQPRRKGETVRRQVPRGERQRPEGCGRFRPGRQAGASGGTAAGLKPEALEGPHGKQRPPVGQEVAEEGQGAKAVGGGRQPPGIPVKLPEPRPRSITSTPASGLPMGTSSARSGQIIATDGTMTEVKARTSAKAWRWSSARTSPPRPTMNDQSLPAEVPQQNKNNTKDSGSCQVGGGKKEAIMELIRLVNITKTYHLGEVDVPVLKGVSATIHRGEMVALMGASGSGKTTLMNILGCLDRPSSGEYWFDGQEMSQFTPNQRALVRTAKLGFVFQSFNLLPRTSALHQVIMPLDYSPAAAPRAEAHRLAYMLLDRVGLADRIDHEPSQMSGGQQQRVAIARSLVNRPALLLADEPTGNLDSHTSVEILRMFQQLNAEGITVILVTHDPKVATFAHRVIRIADGLIEGDETHPSASAGKRTAALDDPFEHQPGGNGNGNGHAAPATELGGSGAAPWASGGGRRGGRHRGATGPCRGPVATGRDGNGGDSDGPGRASRGGKGPRRVALRRCPAPSEVRRPGHAHPAHVADRPGGLAAKQDALGPDGPGRDHRRGGRDRHDRNRRRLESGRAENDRQHGRQQRSRVARGSHQRRRQFGRRQPPHAHAGRRRTD